MHAGRSILTLAFFVASAALAAPFRPVGLKFPLEAGTSGPLKVVRAFPKLKFDRPVFLLQAPDATNRVFVVEQWGFVKVFDKSNTARKFETFFDGESFIEGDDGEMGLLGLAFAPDFARSQTFYIAYNAEGPRRLVLARMRTRKDNPNRADLRSREVLLEIPKNEDEYNHNGGMLAFGPDGMLYLGSGDGGGAGDRPRNAQNMQLLLGKLLRLDVRPERGYRVPDDNPFVGKAGIRPEIWAAGLRNPWRFSFDRVTGRLWLGDVGQEKTEEINLIEKGANYGWNVFEGNEEFHNPDGLAAAGFAPPLFTYPHDPELSITGGYVYRGSRFPHLQGTYVYGDYGSGRIWGLRAEGNRVISNVELGRVPQLSSFGEDRDGELYMVAIDGKIFRFDPNSRPVSTIPEKLSETGLFSDLRTLAPVAGLEEYEVRAPLWSDGARKRRWIALPASGQIRFDAREPWQFPLGTVLVKHFELAVKPDEIRRLETRVFVNHREGWRGYTYKWDATGREAVLQDGASVETYRVETADGQRTEQSWYFPSRTDCLSCHAASAGEVLGVRTAQLNFAPRETAQLAQWNDEKVFATDIGRADAYPAFSDPYDAGGDLNLRARSYLAANCAQCHNPQGVAPGRIDLRFDTPLADAGLLDVVPTQGDLGIPGARRIAPGDRTKSVLYHRVGSLDKLQRMPPLASNVVDAAGLALLGEWIDAMGQGLLRR